MSWARLCSFTANGDPKGQPRPRAFARGGRASVYNPATAEGWKGFIALAARNHLPPSPLDCPVRVDVSFFFARPARLLRKRDPDGPILHTAKPDRDNLDKAVLDCLTSIGMWRDDALVCSGLIEKHYTARGQAPGAHIQISVWKEDP